MNISKRSKILIGGTGITDVIVNNPATFPALGVVLSGAGTGVGTLTYANSATSGTLTFPAVTDTLAVLGTAQTFTAAQTFNGGIIFNAAGSIASTSTFIEADGAGGNLIFNAPTGKNPIFDIAGSTALKVVANGAGLGGFQTGAGWVVRDDGSGNLEAIAPGGDILKIIDKSGEYMGLTTPAQNVSIRMNVVNQDLIFEGVPGSNRYSGGFTIPSPSIWVRSSETINLQATGTPFITGAGLLFSIGTTSTTIATYTPTSATGQNFNIKWVLSAASATTPTLTVSWTDPKAGAQTVTLFSSAMTASSVQSGVYPLVATSASAITVSASALIGADIFATATVSQEQ